MNTQVLTLYRTVHYTYLSVIIINDNPHSLKLYFMHIFYRSSTHNGLSAIIISHKQFFINQQRMFLSGYTLVSRYQTRYENYSTLDVVTVEITCSNVALF